MTIQRGDVYFVNLNPVQGREQGGNARFWFSQLMPSIDCRS